MRRLIGAAVLAGAVAMGGVTVPAQAVLVGNQGCTPGYWKNHTDNWEESTPGTLVGSEFTGATAFTSSATFLQALSFTGGSGLAGAERILMRAAVAAWLNAAHDGLGYPLRRPAIVRAVNTAIASGDRAKMLAEATRLDDLNNAAEGCPLS